MLSMSEQISQNVYSLNNNSEMNHVNHLIFDKLHDLYGIISNSDSQDEGDPDNMLVVPSSHYYSVANVNELLTNLTPKALKIFHCNIRSLGKILTC